MRMIKVDNQRDLPDLGVKVDLQIVDNKVEAVVITGQGGDVVRICVGCSYSNSIKILVEQPLEDKEVWVVEGRLLGLIDYTSEEFEEEYSAKDHLNAIERKHNLYGEDLGVAVVKKIVKVKPTVI